MTENQKGGLPAEKMSNNNKQIKIMTKYIDKDKVAAEIKRRIKVSQDYAKCNLTENTKIGNQAQLLELNDILSFLDTLETKGVDLQEEIDKELDENWYGEYINLEKFRESAKHFFELGLKAKGE